jgi:Protein of unknown function (DUF3142)
VRWTGIALALLLAACGPRVEQQVDPAEHDAFYLWAGVRPPPVLTRARTLYILDGEVRRDGSFIPLRAVPRVDHAEVWLVVRAARIDWGEGVYVALLGDLSRWEAAGNRVAGLQVDFDAATPRLGDYAMFLRGLRGRLPARYQLSVTGLMDWSANADPAALASLRGTIDEVVVQSYQGRTTIPGYDRYLERLARVPVPHKVSLIEGGEWREPAALRRDPLFRGYVVFLLNPDQRD